MFIGAPIHPPDGGCQDPARQASLAAAQRTRIMDAMAATVAELGYVNTTIRPVVTRARVSSGTFYELFEDKEDCFLATVDQRVERLIDTVRSRCAAEPDASRRFQAGLEAFLALCAEEPDTAHLCVIELQAAGPAARSRRAAMMDRLAELAGPALVVTRPRSARDAMPQLTAMIVLGGIHHLVQDRLARGDAERLPQMAPEILRLVLPAMT